ncbi:hypothetical protein ACJ41O_007151 [Fusarium nematophilum]
MPVKSIPVALVWALYCAGASAGLCKPSSISHVSSETESLTLSLSSATASSASSSAATETSSTETTDASTPTTTATIESLTATESSATTGSSTYTRPSSSDSDADDTSTESTEPPTSSTTTGSLTSTDTTSNEALTSTTDSGSSTSTSDASPTTSETAGPTCPYTHVKNPGFEIPSEEGQYDGSPWEFNGWVGDGIKVVPQSGSMRAHTGHRLVLVDMPGSWGDNSMRLPVTLDKGKRHKLVFQWTLTDKQDFGDDFDCGFNVRISSLFYSQKIDKPATPYEYQTFELDFTGQAPPNEDLRLHFYCTWPTDDGAPGGIQVLVDDVQLTSSCEECTAVRNSRQGASCDGVRGELASNLGFGGPFGQLYRDVNPESAETCAQSCIDVVGCGEFVWTAEEPFVGGRRCRLFVSDRLPWTANENAAHVCRHIYNGRDECSRDV